MMNKNTNINERISYLIDIKSNGNKKKFAETIGFAPQVVSNIVSGRKSKPSFDVLNSVISSFADVDSEWLLTGKGEMLKEQNQSLQLHNNGLKVKDKIIPNQEVPLYDFQATAGLLELFNSSRPQEVLDTIKIPNLPMCDGAISVTGDSMYPLLKSGDIILFKQVGKELSNIYYGEMYLLGISNEFDEYITVKYVQKSDLGDNYIKLVSQNQHHQPKDVHISSISALAMVKASIRFNTMF